MISCDVKIRKWGNSLGVTLPKDMVDSNGLKENEEITLLIAKRFPKADELFGIGKGKIRIDAQKMKDRIRREEKMAEARHPHG